MPTAVVPGLYFNSTMVRLKGDNVCLNCGSFTLFQFHYGTIKRARLTVAPLPTMDFNSTMVRLKDCW